MLKQEIKEYISNFYKLGDENSGLFTVHLIEFIYSRMAKRNNAFLARFGITFVQFNVLSLMYKKQDAGINQLEISKNLFVSQGNITRLLERMQKDGLISRNVAQADRRSKLVKLTDKGKNIFLKANSGFEEYAKEYCKKLDEVETLKKLLAEWFFYMKED